MTRIVEERHPGEPAWLWKAGNATAIDSDVILSLGVAWLFKENGKWCFLPRLTGSQALYYNAVLFVRYSTCVPLLAVQLATALTLWVNTGSLHALWPLVLGLFWHLRWSATGDRAYWQAGAGYKLNGRLGVLFRIQGDEASAAGVTGPNIGQAQGFDFGPH